MTSKNGPWAAAMEDVSRVCGTLGDDGDDKALIVPPDVLRRLPKHSALVINMPHPAPELVPSSANGHGARRARWRR